MSKLLDFDAENAENGTVIEGEAEDVTGLQDNIDAQLSEVFEQFGGDEQDSTFKINIYHVQEGRGELGYCFSCVPSELPILDKVQSDFGAGKYEMRLYEKTDKTRLKKRTKFVIEAARKKPAAPQQHDMSAILAAMAAQQQRSMEQFKELLLMQRPATAPAAPQTSMTELIAAMAGLQNMMPKPAENNSMEMFLKGAEMVKDFAGDSGGGREKGLYDMLIEAAKTFGGPIVEMAKNAAPMLPPGAAPMPPGAAPALPPGTVLYAPPGQPGSLNPPPATVQPDPSEVEQMNLVLSMQVNNLVSKAAAGADPALYADLILDSMNEVQIREFIGQPDLKGFLISVNPQVETLWPWFEKLQSEVMAGLTTEETPADTIDIIETETPGTPSDATKPSPKGDATTDT